MNLQQLRYIREVVRQGFNISAASETLYTAQPGISHQIKRLEEELGVAIFDRHGKRLTGLTQPGRAVVAMAERILREIEQMRELSAEFANEEIGQLSIATTHTQARYALPAVIRRFIERYPHISLQIHQGRPDQIVQWVARGIADIGLATEGLMNSPDLIALPCYEWNHCLIAPPGLPLLRKQPLTLDDIAEYPIVTYDKAIAGRERIDEAFANRAIRPRIALSAIDSDVIKTYVEIGLGVGIVARMAFDPERDSNLRMLDASHLFAASTSYIALRRGLPPRNFLYTFIAMLSPQLDRTTIDEAMTR